MKVLIVEDEQLAAERLEQMIREYDANIDILGPVDTVGETLTLLENVPDLDVLFLDIQLADGKSFEIFEKAACDKPVIFTTAFDQYALRAFKHNSIDYLLKPIRAEELKSALAKFKRLNPADRPAPLTPETVREIIQHAQRLYKKRFVVRQGTRILYKPVDEIACLFADGKLVYLVTREESRQYLVDHTLEELEVDQLDPALFFRISRKYIIHIGAIREIRNVGGKLELWLTGTDEPLPVSREKTISFKQWLNQ